MNPFSGNDGPFSLRQLFLDAKAYSLSLALVLTATGLQSHAFQSHSQLSKVANAALNHQTLADYGYALATILLFASPLAVAAAIKPGKRTKSAMATILMRVSDWLNLGGVTMAAICFAVVIHLWCQPTFAAPAPGELPLRGYVFYGTGFAVASFVYAQVVKMWCRSLKN